MENFTVKLECGSSGKPDTITITNESGAITIPAGFVFVLLDKLIEAGFYERPQNEAERSVYHPLGYTKPIWEWKAVQK